MDNVRCYSEYEAAKMIGLTHEALMKRRKRGIGPQWGTWWPGGAPKYSLLDLAEYKRPSGCQPHVTPDISRLGPGYFQEPQMDSETDEPQTDSEADSQSEPLSYLETITSGELKNRITNAIMWLAGKRGEIALGLSATGQIVVEFEGERLPDMPSKRIARELYNALVRIRRASATKGQRPGEQPGRLGEGVGLRDRHEQRKESKAKERHSDDAIVRASKLNVKEKIT